mgnify:CR=1 FL=1
MLMLRSDLSKTKQNRTRKDRTRKDKATQTPPMLLCMGDEIQAEKHEAIVLGHCDNRRHRIRRQL